MKKITSFFAAMMLMLVGAPVFAQTEGCLSEISGKSITISEEITEEIVPGQWYLMYNNRVQGSPAGEGYIYDKAIGTKGWKSQDLTAVQDGDITDEKACYLVRFVEGVGLNPTYPSYYLQFGTGNWIGDDLKVVEDQDDALLFNVGIIAETAGHYWFLKDTENTMGDRLDNNGPGQALAFWETGLHNDENNLEILTDAEAVGRNYDFQFYPVEFSGVDSLEMMKTKVSNRFNELIELYDAFEPGTEIGQYDPAKVEEFQASLDDVAEKLDDPEFEPTVPVLQAMLDRMNKAYADVVASQVKFQPQSGWYYIRTHGVDYQETLPDTEDPETGEPIQGETVSVPKAMYATSTNAYWGTFNDTTVNASFLWRFDYDAETEAYKVYNGGYDNRFAKVKTSADVTLDATLDPVASELKVYFNSKDGDGVIGVSLRRVDQSNEDYAFLHQGGHGGGAGKKGSLVGWGRKDGESFIPASQWTMELVDDATAQELINAYAPVKDRQKLIAAYDSIKAVAVAELGVAEDVTIEKENLLVTDASQLYSEFTEASEGSIEGAVDGDFDTFWHSQWSGGTVPNGTHYLQFNLNEPLSGGVALYYVRRNAAADQSLRFSIYASETGTGTKSEWTKLGEVSFNDNRTVKVPVYSTGFMFTGEYSHFRAYMEESTNNRGYWHCAEMNLVPVVQNPNSQAAHMGELYTDLKFVLNEQQDVTHETLTIEHYNALKAALDAFNTKYVDPTELRNAISAAEPKTALVVEGTDPGYWPAGSSATGLVQLIGNAKDYDASGDYTPAQSKAYVDSINNGVTTLFDQAIKMVEGKWYQFQFPVEDMYDDNGWDKAGAEEKTNSETGVVTALPLYGKVVALGVNVQDENNCWVPEAIAAEDARQGQQLVYIDEDDLEEIDHSYFRLVNVGDSAYALQNKATGLFVDLAPDGYGKAYADLTPRLFNQEVVGLGVNFMATKTVDGKSKSYMHAQHATMTVCSWNASTLGCNSMFMIHEVGDVEAEPTTEFKKEVEPGKVYSLCYATEYSATDGGNLYEFKGINIAADTAVVLTPITKAEAGHAAIFIADGEFEEEAETFPATFMRGAFAPVAAPVDVENQVYSTFAYGKQIPKGYIVPKDGGFKVTTSATTWTPYTSVFFWNGTVDVEEGDIRIAFRGKIVDAIEDVMGTVAQNGAIYSVDGKLLQQNGNINNVAKLGKGMYIVNGVKVLVK